MNLKKQLLYYLKLNNLTAAELARRSQVSKQSISDWLAGISPRSIPQVKKIADTLQISLDELCFGDVASPRQEIIPRFTRTSAELFCAFGFDGFFKDLNPKFVETLGWSLEELTSRPSIEFIHVADRPNTRVRVTRLFEKGGHLNGFDNRYVRKDGTYRWIRWNATVSLRDRLVYAFCKDLTSEYPQEVDEKSLMPLKPLVEECIKVYRAGPSSKNVELVLEDGSNPLALCHPTRMSSAVLAILNQATSTNVDQRNRIIRVKLADSAQGISLKIKAQKNLGTVDVSHQTALNLDVPKSWIQLHSGALNFTECNDFTNYEISLPHTTVNPS